jgi:hypothetical protein
MNTFNVIAGLATLLSVSVNIFQYLWSRKLSDERFNDIEALYSSLYAMAAACERVNEKHSPSPDIMREVEHVHGEINALRRKLISIAKNQYGHQPNYIPPYAHLGNFDFPVKTEKPK